ncbi:unnamed protein product [Nippostrongylus brasiliensis]|uniref:Conjugal transfer protein TraH n=1 Tax=Nippostrongylus brasiliensis TaxID=27835 RepID=A0A0N4Y5W2_NIPBR|nr:unnamed protein product [Nippostrongylus brasiliensis]
MSNEWVVVFFTRAKSVDVVNSEAVIGEPVVGAKRKVKWNETFYDVKSVCEEKLFHVTSDGKLDEYPCEADERNSQAQRRKMKKT